jgi:O-antigen/teichoic acid export membrane protein
LNSPSNDRVSHRTVAGAGVLIASRLGTRCIDLATLFVLGRLLSPSDFGIVAVAMSIMTIVETVMDLPVMQALIRLPALTNAHYNTAFTLGLLRGLTIALILIAASWPVSLIYGDHRLIALLCSLWLAPAARSAGSPLLVNYLKKFDFRPILIFELSGKCVAFLLSAGLAWKTGSYWSIVAGTIAAPLTAAGVSYIINPYLPRLSLREWRDFAGFLGWSTASQATGALNWQLDQLTLARFVSSLDLGRFSMAANLALLPTQVIVTQILAPLMVAFSMIRQDTRRLATAYQNSAATVVAVGIPTMVGLCVIARPLIELVLGDQWLAAVPSLRWLSLAVIPSFFVAPLGPLAMALNRTKMLFVLAAIEFSFKLPLLVIAAMYYGIEGVLVVRVASAILVAGSSMFVVHRLINLPISAQLLSAWRPIVSAIIMILAIVPFEGWLNSMQNVLPRILGLGLVVGVGALVYSGSVYLLWRMANSPDGPESKLADLLGTYSRKVMLRLGR